jgi:hypothetical protein
MNRQPGVNAEEKNTGAQSQDNELQQTESRHCHVSRQQELIESDTST